MEDFRQEANQLVWLSPEDLCKTMSPPHHCLKLKLLLACQFVHNQYRSTVTPHLLCQPTHWNPLELMTGDAAVPSVDWLQIPINQLKSCLSKVDLGVIKACCDLYLSPEA